MPAPSVEVNSAVGAGDAFLAGLLFSLVRDHGWSEALVTATAAGAAVCLTPGTALCTAADTHRLETRVRVERGGAARRRLTSLQTLACCAGGYTPARVLGWNDRHVEGCKGRT